MDRRSFLRGLFAAPAIIAVDRLMPVKLVAFTLTKHKGGVEFDAGLF